MKKIFSLTLALVFCMSVSMHAFAASASQPGSTSGTSGTINTRASLSVSVHSATATTTAGTTDGVTLYTSVTFYYRDPNSGHILPSPASGGGSATAGYPTRSGVNAKSQHTVDGGTRWGDWGCNLTAAAT